MDKIIVEVGSICTKIDRFNGETIEKLERKTIQFKKHYNEDKKLREQMGQAGKEKVQRYRLETVLPENMKKLYIQPTQKQKS